MLKYLLLVAFAAVVVIAQRGHDPCHDCDFIIRQAEHHFHNNITDKTALKQELLVECQWLGRREGQQAAAHCTDVVNKQIDKIFADLQAGDRIWQTCEDIGECQPHTGGTRPIPASTPQAPRQMKQRH
ncbi:unnamed protein product, partial [Mesorhabditis spiculigera]